MKNKHRVILCTLDRTPICSLSDRSGYVAMHIKEELSINEIIGLTFQYPIVNGGKWTSLQNEQLILFNDEYYRIKNLSITHDEDGNLYLDVTCKHYSDNLANGMISMDEQTPKNVIDLMKIALCYDDNGVPEFGWSVGNVTVDRTLLRGLEAVEQSPFSILLTIAEKFDGILKFNSKTMTVDMLANQDTDHPTFDLRVSKNLKSFNIEYDTSEMYTRLYCYGATDDNGNELDITSVHPESKPYIENFDYFKKIGYSEDFIQKNKSLFLSTNIWSDDNFVDANDLYQEGLKQSEKVANPVVNVTVSALDMSVKNGNDITKFELGACVRIYDMDLGADVLCNVIKRTIDYDNPYVLTCEITSAITYHDTLSQLFTNVNTTSKIVTSGGNLVGGQGTTMDNVKDYLNLNYLNASQIEAKYVTSIDLKTYYLTAEDIRTNYLDADAIGAKYATIANLNAVEAKIKDLDVDSINAKFGQYEDLFAQNAEFHKLVATDAEINDLKANNLTVMGKLSADKAEVDKVLANKVSTNDFETYKATIEKLFATYATIEYLETNYITAKQIEGNYAKITELDATNANITTLKTDLATVQDLVAKKASIEDLNAANAKIDTLNTDVANINKLMANKVEADYVQAEIAKANKVITDDLKAIHAVVDTLDTKYATIEQLNAAKANLEDLIAKKASIDDLNAAKADIGSLNTLVANINSILAGNIGTGTLQTIHLTANNVVIDDAIIKSANIEGLDVSKLNAGTISTDKFTIQSDSGGIIITGSTQQFKDKNGKVRLQVGQDAKGNFNFIVFGEDGTTAIYNENGITKNAVPDGLIVDQMVADNANIQASKVQYIDKDGNKTLQTVIEQEQGKITSLIKETETIKGDVSSLSDKYNETVKTVEGNTTTIANIKTSVDTNTKNISSMDSRITEIKQTADGVSTTVTNNKSKWDKASTDASSALTKATQNADKFSWLVKSGTSSTDFTLTDRTAELVAENINLNGRVTFKGLSSDAQTKISNAESNASTALSTAKTANSTASTASTNASSALEKANDLTTRANNGEFDGRGVSSTKVEYQASTSGTTTPTSTWSTSIPTVANGSYLWTRTTITYTDKTTSVSYSVARMGTNGSKGDTGTSVTVNSITITYGVSTSASTKPTSWSGTIPTVSAGQYLWTKTTIAFSDGKTAETYTYALQGIKGDKGDAGTNGTNGTNGKDGTSVTVKSTATTYGTSTSPSTKPTSWSSTMPTSIAQGSYLWTKTIVTYSDGKSTETYTYALQGKNGTNGTNGTNGVSPTVSSTKNEYQQSSSGTSVPTGTWSTTPPSATAGQYMWTKTTITYSDGKTAISYSVGRNGSNGATGAMGQTLANGKLLYKDVKFDQGMNGVGVYNNSSNSNVTITRQAKSSDNPCGNYELLIKNVGTSSPSCGGFAWSNKSRANAVFVYRIIAKIPTGRNIIWAANAFGSGANAQWLTSQNGTGKFTEYVLKATCGATGSFSSIGYFYIDGSVGTTDNPVTWNVAYAGCWDMTDYEDKANQSIIDNWAKDSIVNGETIINGGYIRTNTIKTDQLAVDDIFASGSSVMNILNATQIDASRISTGQLDANRLNAYGLTITNKTSKQQTFNVSPNGEVTMRGSVSSYDYHNGKTGWTINSDGSAEFNNVDVRGSVITNDGGIASSGGSGENLLLNSSLESNLDGWVNNSGYATTTLDGYNCTKVSGSLTTTKLLQQSITLKIKKDTTSIYTISGWVKLVNYKAGSTNPFCSLYFQGAYNNNGTSTWLGSTGITGNGSIIPQNNKGWQYITYTFRFAQIPTYMNFCVYARDFTGDLYVRDLKLEEGDIATPWSAAKDDKIKQVRFWAGATYEERENAPFVVYNDGWVKATQGEFSGIWTGDIKIGNISIVDPSASSGNDALLTIQNGDSGVKSIQLTDGNSSTFAQDLIISTNTSAYTPMITLKTDGTAVFNRGINIANSVTLNGSSLLMNNKELTTTSTGFLINGSLDVGSTSQTSNLVVHGSTTSDDIVVNNELRFGSVIKFTKMSNGINIDFIE